MSTGRKNGFMWRTHTAQLVSCVRGLVTYCPRAAFWTSRPLLTGVVPPPNTCLRFFARIIIDFHSFSSSIWVEFNPRFRSFGDGRRVETQKKKSRKNRVHTYTSDCEFLVLTTPKKIGIPFELFWPLFAERRKSSASATRTTYAYQVPVPCTRYL